MNSAILITSIDQARGIEVGTRARISGVGGRPPTEGYYGGIKEITALDHPSLYSGPGVVLVELHREGGFGDEVQFMFPNPNGSFPWNRMRGFPGEQIGEGCRESDEYIAIVRKALGRITK